MHKKQIINIHDKVLTFLLDWRRKNSGFTFALRKSDLSKKLSEGYWFYGTNELLVLSFWSGMDWKGRVPNISFCYNIKDKESYIQISVRDSPEKQKAIRQVFETHFPSEFSEGEMYFTRSPFIGYNDLLQNLTRFLLGDKKKIDDLIRNNRRLLATKQNVRNQIGLISEEEFTKNLKRTLRYKSQIGSEFLPIGLSSIEIEDFGPIRNIVMDQIPPNSQWIFLTGENGTGKTSILRAMATGFTNGTLGLGPKTIVSNNYKLTLKLSSNGRDLRARIIKKNRSWHGKTKILTKGFVAFGPIRLNISEEEPSINSPSNKPDDIFERPYLHLFSTKGFLIDIGIVYNSKWRINALVRGNEEKIRFIIEAITRICESIVDIHFGRSVMYFEADKEGKLLNEKGTTFRNLASGYKSIIAMISHMMLHLYYQQKNVNDPSELCGIVIIDEIDLHFHPKMQRELVIKLSEIFPRIQFIASTHSPIPLLGAPANSVIFTVSRDAQRGVYVERMDKKVAFDRILPNAILTSPIFGLDDIIPFAHTDNVAIRTEDTFNEIAFNDRVRVEISNYLSEKREKDLLNLFKKKE